MATKQADLLDAIPVTPVYTADSFVGFDDEYLDYLEEGLEESGSIPSVQMISPPKDLKAAQIKQGGFDYGLFIPLDSAQNASFVPSDKWREIEIILSEEEDAEPVKGYIASDIRMVVLHRSSVEIQKQNDGKKGYSFYDVGFRNGQKTEAYALAELDKEVPRVYRKVNRTLIMLLNPDNSPMHEMPFQFTMRGAFNVSFGEEMRNIYQQYPKASCEYAKDKGRSLPPGRKISYKVAAGVILDFSLGAIKFPNKATFTAINRVSVPAWKEVGKTRSVMRGDRSTGEVRDLEMVSVDFRALTLSPNHPTGAVIGSLFDSFIDFSKPNRGRAAGDGAESLDESTPHVFFGKGDIPFEPIKDETGIVRFLLEFQSGNVMASQWCKVSGTLADEVLERWTASDIKVSGAFGLSSEWSDNKPVVVVEKIDFEPSESPNLSDADTPF